MVLSGDSAINRKDKLNLVEVLGDRNHRESSLVVVAVAQTMTVERSVVAKGVWRVSLSGVSVGEGSVVGAGQGSVVGAGEGCVVGGSGDGGVVGGGGDGSVVGAGEGSVVGAGEGSVVAKTVAAVWVGAVSVVRSESSLFLGARVFRGGGDLLAGGLVSGSGREGSGGRDEEEGANLPKKQAYSHDVFWYHQ